MPSWSPAPHGVPFWSEVSPVLTLPRASARPKRFAPGKTLMPGGIHFRRADFILTWAPMRRLRRPMGHTRPGIWPGTPSWSPAPLAAPCWSKPSAVLTLPRASARPKRFAPGKTLMPGGIHFRRADFILTWAPMRRLRRPMGHTRPGIWPGTPSWSPAPLAALCWSKSGLSPDSARRVKDAAPYAWGVPGGETCLPCRGGYHPPASPLSAIQTSRPSERRAGMFV